MTHHPICNCNGSWWRDALHVYECKGLGGYLYLDRCQACKLNPWWTAANDQAMEDLKEMNQCQ